MKNNKKNYSYEVVISFAIAIITIFILFVCIRCCNKINVQKQPTTSVEAKTPLEAIKNDTTIYIDSISIVWINQDSLDRIKFKKDSIAFAKSCKIINGGYNGYKERYKIWLRARNAIKNNN